MIVLNLKVNTHKLVNNIAESEDNTADHIILSSKNVSRKSMAYVKPETIVKQEIKEDLTEEQQKYLNLYNELHENKEVSSFKARVHVYQKPETAVVKSIRKAKPLVSTQVQEEAVKPVEEKTFIETHTEEKEVHTEEQTTTETSEIKKETKWQRFWRSIGRFFRRLFKNKGEN